MKYRRQGFPRSRLQPRQLRTGLSDEQVEFQINDRLSFQRFLGLSLADKAPDGNTIWDFRESLVKAGVFEKLFMKRTSEYPVRQHGDERCLM